MKATTLLAGINAFGSLGPALGSLALGILLTTGAFWLSRLIDRTPPACGSDGPRTFYELTCALAHRHDPQEWAIALCRHLVQRLCVSFAAIVTQVNGSIEVLAASTSQPSMVLSALTGEAAVVFAADPVEPHHGAAARAPLWIPLRIGGVLYGLLAIGPKRNDASFRRGDRQLLRAIAGLAAEALYDVELAEQLQFRTDQLRQLNEQLLGAREQERHALARDLHDGPLQRLALVSSLLGTADEQAAARIIAQQNLAIAELRNLCHGLRAGVLDDLGLIDAIESLVEEVRSTTEATVLFSADPQADTVQLDGATQVTLVRLAQSAIHNCLRHAAASVIAVRIAVVCDGSRRYVQLTIEDNGQGFVVPTTADALTASGHFGLAGMTERMCCVGGSSAASLDTRRGYRGHSGGPT